MAESKRAYLKLAIGQACEFQPNGAPVQAERPEFATYEMRNPKPVKGFPSLPLTKCATPSPARAWGVLWHNFLYLQIRIRWQKL